MNMIFFLGIKLVIETKILNEKRRLFYRETIRNFFTYHRIYDVFDTKKFEFFSELY